MIVFPSSGRWARVLLVALAVAGLVSAQVEDPAKDAKPSHTVFPLFRSANMAGADKLSSGVAFHSFRIPATVTTSTGRILTFAEGRRHDNRDFGDINVVFKRTKTTSDNGATIGDWEGLQEVVGKGNGTWGNPTPVVDGDTIYLFLSWNAAEYSQDGNDKLPNEYVTKPIDNTWEGRRHLYLTQSTDDGKTWTEPEDLTRELTPEDKAWDAVGPGNGIILTSGEVVVPADGRNIVGRGPPGKRTWSRQDLSGAGSEGTIAETFDSRLYRNDRGSTADNYRKVARGDLSSFGPFSIDEGLPDPSCQGSTLVYNRDDDNGPARMLFMNSAHPDRRVFMRVRISYDDDASTWNYGRELSDFPVNGAGNEGGYSSMTKTRDFHVGALVETDWQNGGDDSAKNSRALIWRRFNLSWILNGPRG